jgi:hypothetical protein
MRPKLVTLAGVVPPHLQNRRFESHSNHPWRLPRYLVSLPSNRARREPEGALEADFSRHEHRWVFPSTWPGSSPWGGVVEFPNLHGSAGEKDCEPSIWMEYSMMSPVKRSETYW